MMLLLLQLIAWLLRFVMRCVTQVQHQSIPFSDPAYDGISDTHHVRPRVSRDLKSTRCSKNYRLRLGSAWEALDGWLASVSPWQHLDELCASLIESSMCLSVTCSICIKPRENSFTPWKLCLLPSGGAEASVVLSLKFGTLCTLGKKKLRST